MCKWFGWLIFFLFASLFLYNEAYGQAQDVDFHISAQLLTGKKILKAKRDFYDPYLWVLADNDQVFRVNSQTLAVDDYTAKFASYNNLQFIDIAAVDQNTVYIATSPTLIVFNNGNIKLLSSEIGINDAITSIGKDPFGLQELIIATQSGIDYYNLNGDHEFGKSVTNLPNKIFETSFRRLMYTGTDYLDAAPPSVPVQFYTPFNGYAYNINHTNDSGTTLNTAFYTLSDNTQSVYLGYFFWGNQNGMFEEYDGWEQAYPNAYARFLNNVKINKITDILGLTSLGNPYTDPGLIKETLLIGSDNGFYFTSSLFHNYDNTGLLKFSIFHYDLLGNTPVNDICVNPDAATFPLSNTDCETGVWLSTNTGLYYLTPDYAKYVDPKTQLHAISFNLPNSDNVTHTDVCTGSSVALVVNSFYTNNNTIQWEKDGQDIVGQTGSSLTVTQTGEYYAIIYTPCGNVHVETNHLTVTSVPGPVFTFNYQPKTEYCDITSTELDVTNNPNYQYRWYQDGALNGNTTASQTVTQSGKYKVDVSLCPDSWVTSKEVEVDLMNLPQPVISSDKNSYCQSDVASLSSGISIDPSYNIEWYKDNALLPEDENLANINTTVAGNYTVRVNSNISTCNKISTAYQLNFTPAPIFTFNYPAVQNFCLGTSTVLQVEANPAYNYRWYKNGVLNNETGNSITVNETGKYKIEVSACEGSWVPSNEVQVNFIQLPVPAITADKNAYCIGDQAKLHVNVPFAQSYTITWVRDGNIVPDYQDMTDIVTVTPGIYSIEISSKIAEDCLQVSQPLPISFSPPPTVSIDKIVNTNLCSGQTVDLKVNYSGGSIQWSTGETSQQISVTSSGNYKATVTTPAGCTNSSDIDLTFFPNPVLPVIKASLCEYTRQTVTLTAPAGFSKYVWNGIEGNNTYTVNSPQTVTLTVTDANGCQATQQIAVTNECADIHIPNAFTPNGDGVNDNWVISGAGGDLSLSVKIYNRYGTLLFQSKGNYTPWDGTYNGNKLPAGVYYYIVTAKKGQQVLSGSVTIVY